MKSYILLYITLIFIIATSTNATTFNYGEFTATTKYHTADPTISFNQEFILSEITGLPPNATNSYPSIQYDQIVNIQVQLNQATCNRYVGAAITFAQVVWNVANPYVTYLTDQPTYNIDNTTAIQNFQIIIPNEKFPFANKYNQYMILFELQLEPLDSSSTTERYETFTIMTQPLTIYSNCYTVPMTIENLWQSWDKSCYSTFECQTNSKCLCHHGFTGDLCNIAPSLSNFDITTTNSDLSYISGSTISYSFTYTAHNDPTTVLLYIKDYPQDKKSLTPIVGINQGSLTLPIGFTISSTQLIIEIDFTTTTITDQINAQTNIFGIYYYTWVNGSTLCPTIDCGYYQFTQTSYCKRVLQLNQASLTSLDGTLCNITFKPQDKIIQCNQSITKTCGDNGICIPYDQPNGNTCQCNTIFYTGQYCQYSTCTQCSTTNTLECKTSDNICICKDGYEGSTCDQPKQVNPPDDDDSTTNNFCTKCNINNIIECDKIKEICTCKSGFGGIYCDNSLTSSCSQCSIDGLSKCGNDNSCICKDGYIGTLCDEKVKNGRNNSIGLLSLNILIIIGIINIITLFW